MFFKLGKVLIYYGYRPKATPVFPHPNLVNVSSQSSKNASNNIRNFDQKDSQFIGDALENL